MTDQEKLETRERILKTAASLFYKKGFAGTGVREIAAEANVNIAMISYYFQGKNGILKAIMERYFQLMGSVFKTIDTNLEPEEGIRQIIRKIVRFIHENHEIVLVFFNEIPFDNPELAEVKIRYMHEILIFVQGYANHFGVGKNKEFIMSIVGPSLISAILTNYRLRPFLGKAIGVRADEAYNEAFIETYTQFFLYGIHGFRKS